MTLEEVQQAVERHRAVVHPLIKRLSHNPNDRLGWRIFASHHHHIVREFPYHIQALFLRLPAKLQDKLAPVLTDEFPPGSLSNVSGATPDFSAHAELQLQMCRSLGTEPAEHVLPGVAQFISEHRREAKLGDLAHALGAFGPGHEYAVPVMFRQLVSGSPPLVNPSYMFEHLTIDVDHERRFREVLLEEKVDPTMVFLGAMWSLDRRALAWDDILAAIETEEQCR